MPLLPKIGLKVGLSVPDHSSSFTGSGSTYGCHHSTKLASSTSVFSVSNCTQLTTLPRLSLFAQNIQLPNNYQQMSQTHFHYLLDMNDTDYIRQT
jgi:hypothetical protein